MPQLMPFYWVNSVFMILYILITLVIFYFYKNMENMFDKSRDDKVVVMFNFMW